ncbi:hypothetical protein RRG08_067047 [Elysia crispata]|uniref:Uncharacterized protein n=1 Tax=Elysia crispata TaxID=231223 RepID=A0AAE1B870_9GAST|nr:hypothetical protein RRG08_067047 [Elysia crispata]
MRGRSSSPLLSSTTRWEMSASEEIYTSITSTARRLVIRKPILAARIVYEALRCRISLKRKAVYGMEVTSGAAWYCKIQRGRMSLIKNKKSNGEATHHGVRDVTPIIDLKFRLPALLPLDDCQTRSSFESR